MKGLYTNKEVKTLTISSQTIVKLSSITATIFESNTEYFIVENTFLNLKFKFLYCEPLCVFLQNNYQKPINEIIYSNQHITDLSVAVFPQFIQLLVESKYCMNRDEYAYKGGSNSVNREEYSYNGDAYRAQTPCILDIATAAYSMIGLREFGESSSSRSSSSSQQVTGN
jgi:hypothetical protein